MSEPIETIFDRPYLRWYQFGWRSPMILYKRFQSTHYYIGRPIFRARMMWQRAICGYSIEDCWNLNDHLARVTIGGIQELRKMAHGYPSEISSPEEWDKILAQIEDGFQAWIDTGGWFFDNTERVRGFMSGNAEKETKYNTGMALYAKWFGGLWD